MPIAASCNLNCPYCFAQTDGGFHFGNFTKKDIDRIAAFLVEKNTDECSGGCPHKRLENEFEGENFSVSAYCDNEIDKYLLERIKIYEDEMAK